MQSFLSSCSRHSCLQTISEICYPSFIHSFLTYWIFLQGWYQAHTQNGYTVFLSLMISCLPTQSVIFLPLHFIIHSLLIICLFSNPKTFQVSRCACKLPQTGLCMTLTEIVYDQFQGTHWSFFNKVLLWFYSKVCHCDFTKYSLWNLELPPHVPSSQLETTLKQPCLLWGISVSDFESLVWVLQHKELCLCGPLAQGLRGVVFLQVWSEGHQDQNLWGWGPRICIFTHALSNFCVCWSREISFIIWRKGGF